MNQSASIRAPDVGVKQEVSQSCSNLYGHGGEEFQAHNSPCWSQIMPVSSPRSCASLNSNMLDFSYTEADGNNNNHQNPDHSSECNSTATEEVCKKARVQSSSSQPPLKVRKEKLGDRITALHQLVSPFGKTDTASVLLEAIGYIRFLQGQIEDIQDKPKDLRSRGLCLVPVSCTQQVGSDNGADYWAPALGGGF